MVQIIIKKARSGNRPALKLMKVYPNEQYLDAIPSFAELDALVDTMLLEAGEQDGEDYDLLLDGIPLSNANTIKRLAEFGAGSHVVLKLCPSSVPSVCPSTRTPTPLQSQAGEGYSPDVSDTDDEPVASGEVEEHETRRSVTTGQMVLAALETTVKEQFSTVDAAVMAETVRKLLREFKYIKFAVDAMSPQEYGVVARGMFVRAKKVHDGFIQIMEKTGPAIRKMNLSFDFVGNVTKLEDSLEISQDIASFAMVNAADNIVSILKSHANLMKDVCKDAKKMVETLDDLLVIENTNMLVMDDMFESAKYVASLRRRLSDHLAAIKNICLKRSNFHEDQEEQKKLEDQMFATLDISAMQDTNDLAMTTEPRHFADDSTAALPRVIRITLPWAKCVWAADAEINMTIGADDTVADVRARLAQACKQDISNVKVIADITAILPWPSTEQLSAVSLDSRLSVSLEDEEPLPDTVIIRGLDNPLLHYIKWHPNGSILMRNQAVAMQKELYERFCSPKFQEGLLRVNETVGDHSPRLNMRLKRAACFNEQKDVLPKYGFKASLEGVEAMTTAIRELQNDEVVGKTIAETDREIQDLLGR